jgi:steroid delta-isomerase-like uncharacterized protein
MATTDARQTNLGIAKRVSLELWGDGDITVIDDCYAEDCVVHMGNDTYEGRDAYREAVAGMMGDGDVTVTLDDVFAVDDRVVSRYSFGGTHDSEMMGIPATGKSFASSGINILRFEDGRIVEEWDQSDNLGMLQQLGVVPEQ